MLPATKQTILLIEANSSLRRLITLGLQYHGMNVLDAVRVPAPIPGVLTSVVGIQQSNQHRVPTRGTPTMDEGSAPSLVVLDIDREGKSDWSLLMAMRQHPVLSTLPIVVLTWECPLPDSDVVSTYSICSSQAPVPVVCLTKPFDARILHSTIEQLLVARAPEVAIVGSFSRKPEVVLATAQYGGAINRAPTSAPSLWPLITAAALLLAFIGLMVQIALTAVGLFVVMVALLLWTIGTKQEHKSLAT